MDAPYVDKTPDVLAVRSDASYCYLTLRGQNGGREYRYRPERVAILADPAFLQLSPEAPVKVNGVIWNSATEAWRFDGPDGTWWRIFYHVGGGERYRIYPGHLIDFPRNATSTASASDVLDYWRGIVSGLPADDPLRPSYDALGFVDTRSVLGRYLNASPLEPATPALPLIFPFSANLSQREAVQKSLSHPVSVIEGPPGTGKTQTILNLIANIIATPGATVGVVSSNNSAVDNVREKLTEAGVCFVIASLGRNEKKAEFFAGQSVRNTGVNLFIDGGVAPMPPTEQIADVDRRLQQLQETERLLARLRQERDAYQLELRHFDDYLRRHKPGKLGTFPLLNQPSGRILDYLAETAQWRESDGLFKRLVRKLRAYFRYGPTGSIDPLDTEVVLRLRASYYANKVDELLRAIEEAREVLERGDFAALTEQQRSLSSQAFRAGLHRRYSQSRRSIHDPKAYKHHFAKFTGDYPVILSTCHSLARSLPDGFLLDYLIIDEASQVNLLAAGLALKCARNVIVVGDLCQIQHIADETACENAAESPAPAYDYRRHNILSSLMAVYGETLPRTLLREHYRCDPAIIGFCNKKFYGGQLIPFKPGDSGAHPLTIVRTAAGHHMRTHREGGRFNQREVDVVVREVIGRHFADVDPDTIGIATPYRLQASKFSSQLNGITASTVHAFQGREKNVIIMSTVLDETANGQNGLQFVDDPYLVNVAVSRARKQFVLVTNSDMLPRSRNLRDLIDYIRYHDPAREVLESTIVSVFDLLYKDYSPRLRPLAKRVGHRTGYASEDIIWTVLDDILAEAPYADLDVAAQVMLRELLPDLTRLTPAQSEYVRHRATTLDFVVYNRISNRPVFAIEVDGFAFHENSPTQLVRDGLKDAICATHQIPLLRLPTTGSGEEQRIRRWLDEHA